MKRIKKMDGILYTDISLYTYSHILIETSCTVSRAPNTTDGEPIERLDT